MKMLDAKGDSGMAGDNQGYNPQGTYNQPANIQYDEPSSPASYGGMNQAKPRVEQRIPEIDIDEDEIPF
jgi:single-strand DNA-binding protein